ncbi:MAG: sulfite exporter TauE/SafE family protein [Candidatus Diapherotrites archaeon]|nr:sulfite exporter TauE/SafE family protein [Candidatus Diapherotrites archaeon]
MEFVVLLSTLFIGMTAGFFDSVLGAGGLISIPALMFLGFPPQVAIATDRFGTIGQTSTALFKFHKAKKIIWEYVAILSIISLIGSLIGANILLNIDSNLLQRAVGFFLLALLPFAFLKQNIGIKRNKTTKSKSVLGLFIYFLIMIFGGFFGQGTGPLIFYTLTYFLGFTMIEVLATNIIPWFVLSLASLVIFAMNGIINYAVGIILLVGMAIGGYIGAHVALKKGDLWVKRLFALFVIASGVKMLFF